MRIRTAMILATGVTAPFVASCSKKAPPDPPPPVISSATATVPPIAPGGVAPPVSAFAEVDPGEGKSPFEQARTYIANALQAQQAARGGKLLVLQKRSALPGVSADEIAELERLHYAVGQSIALHKYSGAALPTKRGKGLDYTLGEQAVALGRKTGYDYALFVHAEDNIASTGRTALQVLGVAGCLIGFCAPSGGSNQFAYASLVDLRTGEVVWFNVLQTGSQLPGVKFGDIRNPQGAAQMVDRLLYRMKPGRAVRRAERSR